LKILPPGEKGIPQLKNHSKPSLMGKMKTKKRKGVSRSPKGKTVERRSC